MTKILCRGLSLLLAASASPACADEPVQLDQTTVIDNHELPKITYIVPWQAAPLPQQEKPPLDVLIDDALTPLDRDVLRSRIQYYYDVTTAPHASGQPGAKTDK